MIGRLSTKDTVLFLCDMQEKFRPNIFQFPNIVSNASRLLQVWGNKITPTQLTHLFHFYLQDSEFDQMHFAVSFLTG